VPFVEPVDGIYYLHPDEPPIREWELDYAERLLKIWKGAPTPEHMRGVKCPHVDIPCESEAECIRKIAWYVRYARQIDAIENPDA